MWRPLLIFIANFIAGWLLTNGYIDPADHSATAQGIADGLGYLILGVTSLASIYHALRHPHSTTNQQPVASKTVTTEVKQEQVFTEGFSQNPGTPPASPLP